MPSPSETLVCIPTLNEADSIMELILLIRQEEPSFYVLVIDDNSADGTADVVASLEDPQVSVLRRPGKLGFASAYVDGFRWGLARNFEWIAQMDADMSHHPRHLPSFVSARANCDFVVGSRYIKGGSIPNWSLARKSLSRFANQYARFFLSRKINDYTGGFNMWNRKVLETLDLDAISSRGYSFLIELKYTALRAGYKATEVPISFEDRREGQSKMSSGIIFEAVYRVPMLRFFHR